MLYYLFCSIKCEKCSMPYLRCTSCNDDVNFIPKSSQLTSTKVTVRDVAANANYRFEVSGRWISPQLCLFPQALKQYCKIKSLKEEQQRILNCKTGRCDYINSVVINSSACKIETFSFMNYFGWFFLMKLFSSRINICCLPKSNHLRRKSKATVNVNTGRSTTSIQLLLSAEYSTALHCTANDDSWIYVVETSSFENYRGFIFPPYAIFVPYLLHSKIKSVFTFLHHAFWKSGPAVELWLQFLFKTVVYLPCHTRIKQKFCCCFIQHCTVEESTQRRKPYRQITTWWLNSSLSAGEVWGSITGPVKPYAVLPTARHSCINFLELCCPCAKPAEICLMSTQSWFCLAMIQSCHYQS